MYNKKLLISLSLPVVFPVLDIFPMSTSIVAAFSVLSLLFAFFFRTSIDLNRFRLLLLWLIVSLTFLLVSLTLSYFYYGYSSDRTNYLLRIFLLFTSSLFILAIFPKFELLKIKISDFASLLFLLIIISAVFEFFLRFTNLNDLLYLYKARQDLGGIDSTHYNRFTGFWSFPGDTAAIIVLCLILLINERIDYRFIKILVLLVLLFLTQSKAGIILFAFYTIVHFLFKPSLSKLTIIFFFSSIASLAAVYLNLEYLIFAYNNIDYYFLESKRAQEILPFISIEPSALFIGLPFPSDFYESDLFGSLSRIGILGSFWFLSIILIIIMFYIKSKPSYKNYYLYFLLFLIIYCSVSAGISRLKILFPHLIFFWLVISTSVQTKNSINIQFYERS